jgi:gluconate 2-dehydrogenase gamma chain
MSPEAPANDQELRRHRTLEALAERIYPETEWGPGAKQLGLAGAIWDMSASDSALGLDSYRQRPFAEGPDESFGWQSELSFHDAFVEGLDMVERWSTSQHGVSFSELADSSQDEAVMMLEQGAMPGSSIISSRLFFGLLTGYVFDALFVAPAAGQYSLDGVWTRLGMMSQAGMADR